MNACELGRRARRAGDPKAGAWDLAWVVWLGATLTLSLGLAPGCGDDSVQSGIVGADGGVSPDLTTGGDGSAGQDAGPDAATDTAADAATDTATDAATDTASDTATDAATDAATDTASDTATDAATDTASDTATDVTTDTAADTNSTGLDLTDAEIGQMCGALCKQAAQKCGDLSAVGGSEAACAVQCINSATDDGWWLGNYQCFQLTCSADCFASGEPVTAPTNCDTFCAGMDACGFLPMIDLPDGSAELCRPLCAGADATGPGAASAFQCANDALAEGCSTGAVSACLAPAPTPTCEQICAGFYDATADQYCAPGSDWAAAWPTPGDCEAACATAEAAGASMNFTACTWIQGCGDPSECADIGADVPVDCYPFCSAFQGLCSDLDPGAAAFCPNLCAAMTYTWDTPSSADASQCVASLESCPADPGETFLCLIEPSSECTSMCDDLAACGFFVGTDSPTPEECALQCTALAGQDPATWDPILACVAEATDCPAKGACLPHDSPTDAVCGDSCTQTAACAGDPPLDVDACIQSCAETLVTAGPSGVGAPVCKALAPCDEQLACDAVDLPATGIPAACQTACEDPANADTCADLAPPGDTAGATTACLHACAGALQALGLSGTADATCVVEALTPACAPAAAFVCAPPTATPAALDVQFQGFSGGGPGSGGPGSGGGTVYVRLREAGAATVLASASASLKPSGTTVTFAEPVVGGTYDVEYMLDVDGDGACSDGDFAAILTVGPLTGDTELAVTPDTASYDPSLCQTFYQ